MWRILLALGAAYVVFHATIARREGWRGFSTSGILLTWRTARGSRAFQALARPERAWRAAGRLGFFAVVAMALGILLMLAMSAASAVNGTLVPMPSPAGLRGAVGLPGINPLIPLGYGVVALAIAIIVHEGGHAVMAYANGIRIKSSGILVLGLPIGAFIEPEPDDIQKATPNAKLRVLAAGPAANLALALAAMLLLSALLSSSLHVKADGNGLGVTGLVENAPASALGISVADVLIAADGRAVTTDEELDEILRAKRPGDPIELEWTTSAGTRIGTVTLTAHPEDPTRVMLGVRVIELRYLSALHYVLSSPLNDGGQSLAAPTRDSPPGSLLLYVLYPSVTFMTGVDPLAGEHARFLEAHGPLEALPVPVLVGTATLLYWLSWTNVMLATFNALPIGPLDGGQMLREALSTRAPSAALARRTSQAATALVIALLLAPAFLPRLLHALG